MKFIRGHNSVGMNRSKPRVPNRYAEEDRGFDTPCWIWQLKISTKTGYGIERVGGQDQLAHRAAYQRDRGTIPDGLQLDHLCRVRECCNPSHMEPVTPQENTRRSAAAKLSLEQSRMIYALCQTDEFSNAAIGRMFNVTRETVRLIRQRGPELTRRETG